MLGAWRVRRARRQYERAADLAWIEAAMAENQRRLDEIEAERKAGCRLCKEREEAEALR